MLVRFGSFDIARYFARISNHGQPRGGVCTFVVEYVTSARARFSTGAFSRYGDRAHENETTKAATISASFLSLCFTTLSGISKKGTTAVDFALAHDEKRKDCQ